MSAGFCGWAMEAAEYDRMDAVEQDMWWYRALHRRLLTALAGVHGALLDVGCGTGGLLARLRACRPDLRLTGLELGEFASRRAAAKSGALVAQGSVNGLPFADASFDAVVAADLLCHDGVDPTQALSELRRVLRPGGRAVINMPAYAWLLSAHDRQVHNVRRFTAGQLRTLMRDAGFGGVKASYWNGMLLPFVIAQRKLLARQGSTSDVAAFPPWIDATFHTITEIERRLPFHLPTGSSVLATGERP
jgi:SAM-dependent methyltransferase